MGKRFTTFMVVGILVSGLTLTGNAAHASTMTDSTRTSTCKQISTLLKDIRTELDDADRWIGAYDRFEASGDDAVAKNFLKMAGQSVKKMTKLIKTGSSKAKNPEMKLEFKRWYNIIINDLDNSGSLEAKSVRKIESLLIDGKC